MKYLSFLLPPATVLLVVFLFIQFPLFGQQGYNLIPNGSFEQNRFLPQQWTTSDGKMGLKYWYSPSMGTPDYFTRGSLLDAGVPSNFAGVSYAKEGDSYAGLLFGNGNYEYLAVPLKEVLKKGEQYTIKFSIKPAQYSKFTTDSIDVVFTSERTKIPHWKQLHLEPVMTLKVEGTIAYSPYIWLEVEGSFEATGNEKFLVVGNFNSSRKLLKREHYVSKPSVVGGQPYFLLDNFYLSSAAHEPSYHYPSDSVFSLQHVYFGFDQYKLNSDAKEELYFLSEYLKSNNQILIISGYTDAAGTIQYNKRLSGRRAISVKNQLLQLGIAETRLKTRAMGVYNSKNEQKKAVDRHVAFRLVN